MSNTCQCPNPPGGVVRCNPDQMAVCGIRDGKIVSGCFDKPSHARNITSESERSYVLSNWALSVITGARRKDYDPISTAEFAMLQSGRYVNKRTGEEIRFSVPSDLDLVRAKSIELERV